jgi:hypothetical protein
MIGEWVIDKLSPLIGEKRIILTDPQWMIGAGAGAVDGWAKENGLTVNFCGGNLAFRDMYENLRDDRTTKLSLVDRTRDKCYSVIRTSTHDVAETHQARREGWA